MVGDLALLNELRMRSGVTCHVEPCDHYGLAVVMAFDGKDGHYQMPYRMTDLREYGVDYLLNQLFIETRAMAVRGVLTEALGR